MNSDYNKALDNLLVGIGNDFENWNNPYTKTDWTKAEKRIRIESITKFKETLYVKPGRKFDKVIHGTSVWGFVAKVDGVFKGLPMIKGDVFKAASWKAPAKHARGSILSDDTSWFAWTGPNYL